MKSTGVLTFIIGAAIGVTAGLYLNSENGKELRTKTTKKLSKMEASIEDKVSKAYDDLKSKISDTASNVKSATSNMKDSANNIREAAGNMKESAKL